MSSNDDLVSAKHNMGRIFFTCIAKLCIFWFSNMLMCVEDKDKYTNNMTTFVLHRLHLPKTQYYIIHVINKEMKEKHSREFLCDFTKI